MSITFDRCPYLATYLAEILGLISFYMPFYDLSKSFFFLRNKNPLYDLFVFGFLIGIIS